MQTTNGTSRTNDDVHNSIPIDAMTKTILDTPHLQRLRGLKQLGVCEMAYTTTTHSRFEHSLGVAHLCDVLLRGIQRRQPWLGIREKDVVCVKIAGLLHDVGHGPFSHVYDGEFRHLLARATKQKHWLGQSMVDEQERGCVRVYNKDMPTVMEGWQHEDGSLMMIDSLLEYLGLAIDESNLDLPLKQVGSGIQANCFGICDVFGDVNMNEEERNEPLYYNGKTPLPPHRVLTSRDWIFIKECIIGGPLPPKHMSVSQAHKDKMLQLHLIGRPHPHQEFLYDVVSNRHSGLDVDKMDYLARDERRAFGTAGFVDPLFMENAHVAWGTCPRPHSCHVCKHRNIPLKSHNATTTGSNKEGMHLMICYPEKMVQNAMAFFKQRFKNHQMLYTHQATNAACYMVCDILLLAEPTFRISTKREDERDEKKKSRDDKILRLPISRANTNANSYLKLKDSVLDIIAMTEDPKLLKARKLVNRLQSHNLYKRVVEQPIPGKPGTFEESWHGKVWNMSEEDIINALVKHGQICGEGMGLQAQDIIVEKRKIHHGMKEHNPVSCMRFIPKSQLTKLREAPDNLPVAVQVDESDYECAIPRVFLQRTLRIFCRRQDKEICYFLKTCWFQLVEFLQKRSSLSHGDMDQNEFDNDHGISHRPEVSILSQSPPSSPNELSALNRTESFGLNDEEPAMKKQKTFYSQFNSLLQSP